MLPTQRQAVILDEIQRRGGIRVSDLAEVLQVSPMTVRRDLVRLDQRGLLQKVHGGATLASGEGGRRHQGPGDDALLRRREMTVIARRAAALVEPGAVIGIAAGGVAVALAEELIATPDLTVVTNAPRVAAVFERAPGGDRTVVLTGGVQDESGALVGPLAEVALAQLHVDTLFTGCAGIHPTAGLTAHTLPEAQVGRAFAAAARRLVLLADHTHWAEVALTTFAALDQLDTWITDDGLDWTARSAAAELVRELVLCAAAPEPAARPGA